MEKQDIDAWFAAKRYGYGAGLPIRWQGWAATGLFAGTMATNAALLKGTPRLAVAGLLTTAFIALAAAKTDAPWRWRWGERR